MACLNPGTLQKLLQNAGDKDFKVAGEHRSALLQVIGIVPCLEDDPWKSRGYYLRVSDSLHSAYLSVPNEDMELILSNMVQLGQFIYVTRLDSGSPVPVLRGIKPIPKRRPCEGDPKDLISSDFLNAKKLETKAKPKAKVKKVVGNEEGSRLRRLSFGNGKVGGGVENRRLSFDSARRAWDSGGGSGVSKSKPKITSSPSNSVVAKKALHEDIPKKLVFSPLKTKNTVVSPNTPPKPMKPSNQDGFPVGFSKVTLGSKTRSDQKILWDALPSTVCDLGKDVRRYRKAAFASAVRALEEASLSECIVRCMSMFAELCKLSEKDGSGPLVEQFLSIHTSIKKATEVINTLKHIRSCNGNDVLDCASQCSPPMSKNASSWVQAAVETDLSKFSLYRKGGKNGGKCHYVVIENHPEKPGTKPKPSSKPAPKVKKGTCNTRRRVLTENGEEEARSGLEEMAKLAEKVQACSRSWFLDYLEVSLKRRFGLRRGEMGVLLGQLKRVNQWLDGAFEGDERVEKLRKKLYLFLLENVESAVSNK